MREKRQGADRLARSMPNSLQSNYLQGWRKEGEGEGVAGEGCIAVRPCGSVTVMMSLQECEKSRCRKGDGGWRREESGREGAWNLKVAADLDL